MQQIRSTKSVHHRAQGATSSSGGHGGRSSSEKATDPRLDRVGGIGVEQESGCDRGGKQRQQRCKARVNTHRAGGHGSLRGLEDSSGLLLASQRFRMHLRRRQAGRGGRCLRIETTVQQHRRHAVCAADENTSRPQRRA